MQCKYKSRNYDRVIQTATKAVPLNLPRLFPRARALTLNTRLTQKPRLRLDYCTDSHKVNQSLELGASNGSKFPSIDHSFDLSQKRSSNLFAKIHLTSVQPKVHNENNGKLKLYDFGIRCGASLDYGKKKDSAEKIKIRRVDLLRLLLGDSSLVNGQLTSAFNLITAKDPLPVKQRSKLKLKQRLYQRLCHNKTLQENKEQKVENGRSDTSGKRIFNNEILQRIIGGNKSPYNVYA